MPKKNRLSGVEIRAIRSPRRTHGAFFTLSWSSSARANVRFACVVSKKVALKASDRNLIKRRARAAFQKLTKNIAPGVYMLTAKKTAHGAPYAAIEKDIRALCGGG